MLELRHKHVKAWANTSEAESNRRALVEHIATLYPKKDELDKAGNLTLRAQKQLEEYNEILKLIESACYSNWVAGASSMEIHMPLYDRINQISDIANKPL